MDQGVQGSDDIAQRLAVGSASTAAAAADACNDHLIKLRSYIAAHGGVLADGWSAKRISLDAAKIHMKYTPPEGFIPAAGQPFHAHYEAMTRVAEAMGLATGGPQPKRGREPCEPASRRVRSTKRQRTLAAAQQLPQEHAPASAAPGCPSQQRSRPQQSTNPVQQQGSEAQQAPADPAGSIVVATDSVSQKLLEVLQLNETKNKEGEAAQQRMAALQAEKEALAQISVRQIRQLQQDMHAMRSALQQAQQEKHAMRDALQQAQELEGGQHAELESCKRQLAAAKAEAKELSAKLMSAEGSRDVNAAQAAACKETLNSNNAEVEHLAAELAAARACKESQADMISTCREELKSSKNETTERLSEDLKLANGLASSLASATHREVAARMLQCQAEQNSARLEQELADRKEEYEAEQIKCSKEKETCAAQLVQCKEEAEALRQENDDMLKMVGRADRAAAEARKELKAQEQITAAAIKTEPAHAPHMPPHTPALPNGTAVTDQSACRQEQGQLELENERQVARLQSERAAAEAELHAARQEIAKLKAGGAPQGAAAVARNELGQDQEGVQSILKVIAMANSDPAMKRDLLQALGVRSV